MNLMAGHRLNPKTRANIRNEQLKGIQSGVEIISTSCRRYDVQSWASIFDQSQPQKPVTN